MAENLAISIIGLVFGVLSFVWLLYSTCRDWRAAKRQEAATLSNTQKLAYEALESSYSKDAQDCQARIGFLTKQYTLNGLSLANFMSSPPPAISPPSEASEVQPLLPEPVADAEMVGAMKTQRDTWLEVRSACHRLEGSFIQQAENGHLPDDIVRVGKDGKGKATSIDAMKGLWLRRANNFCTLIEPLAKANYVFIHGSVYNQQSRFKLLGEACGLFRTPEHPDLDLKGCSSPVDVAAARAAAKRVTAEPKQQADVKKAAVVVDSPV